MFYIYKDLIRVTNKFYLALLTSVASDIFEYNITPHTQYLQTYYWLEYTRFQRRAESDCDNVDVIHIIASYVPSSPCSLFSSIPANSEGVSSLHMMKRVSILAFARPVLTIKGAQVYDTVMVPSTNIKPEYLQM